MTLRLGRLSKKDAEMLYDLVDSIRDDLSQTLSWTKDVRLDDIRYHFIGLHRVNGQMFGLFDTLKLVGSLTFQKVSADCASRYTVGYWLHPSYRERGLMKGALQAGMELHRDVLIGKQLIAYTLPTNYASIGVLEGVGFTENPFVSHVADGRPMKTFEYDTQLLVPPEVETELALEDDL